MGAGASGKVAVLASGGLDSAVLVDHLAERAEAVQPMYLRFGLLWEAAEEAALRRFLAAVDDRPALRPLIAFDQPVTDVYGAHWSTSGDGTPDASTPDDAVYLPGRNLLLVAKPAVWCALNGFSAIALGVLSRNPFPDATPTFYRALEAVLGLGLDTPIEILTPFAGMTKGEVIATGRYSALAASFSCIAPAGELHCGRCNKCEERHRAFVSGGWDDPTRYAA